MRGWNWLMVLNREVRKAFLRWWTFRFQRSEEFPGEECSGQRGPSSQR